LAATNLPGLSPYINQTRNDMKNIFVGNLDFGTTEASIRALFEAYGNVEKVNLITDRDTGRSRGFAFVEMSDAAEADRAITALNGTNLDGRPLNINEARPKSDSGGRGFGGGPPRGGRGPGGGGGPRQRREPRW
jgi:RNA recognition motif-containing protein